MTSAIHRPHGGRISPGFAAALLEQIPPERHDEIGEEIAAAAAGGDPDGRVRLGCEAVLASGVK